MQTLCNLQYNITGLKWLHVKPCVSQQCSKPSFVWLVYHHFTDSAAIFFFFFYLDCEWMSITQSNSSIPQEYLEPCWHQCSLWSRQHARFDSGSGVRPIHVFHNILVASWVQVDLGGNWGLGGSWGLGLTFHNFGRGRRVRWIH